MSTILMDKKEELVMRLVHYFVTKCNYTPIIVNGVKNEIWLENIDGPYRIIRINSNYIHNIEQFNTDIYKIKNIVGQIKRKTLSFKMDTLNINLDLNNGVKLSNGSHIDSVFVKNNKDIKENKIIIDAFPNIRSDLLDDTKGIDLIINVTNDINKKTAKDNKIYERTFSQKKIIVTYVIMALCILTYIISLFKPELYYLFADNKALVKSGEVWRVITSCFMHGNGKNLDVGLIHLGINMYSLYIIGSQLENFIGKFKFTLVYLFSALIGSLMSCAFLNSYSVGASGAIFGLMGSLLYFGYHYRLYLSSVIKSQIIPLIIINLAIGFMPGSNIDNFAHIGGLIGGYLATMIVGIDEKTTIQERVNGIVVSVGLALVFIFLIFFK